MGVRIGENKVAMEVEDIFDEGGEFMDEDIQPASDSHLGHADGELPYQQPSHPK